MKNREKALLLINLGSPDSTEVRDVRTYLNEFLMDGWVIDFPSWFRFLLMRGIVVPRRAPKSAEAYRTIWTKAGSPLIVSTASLCEAVQQRVDFPVYMAMRYGSPSFKATLAAIHREMPNLKELTVLPLYPHYTMSSFGTAVRALKRINRKEKYPFDLKFFTPFFHHPAYINALAESMRPYLEQPFDKVLFSYHGIPERHMRKDGDFIRKGGFAGLELPSESYAEQCRITTRLVAEVLGLPEDKMETSFQSRLTSAGGNWVKPYSVNRLEQLPGEGVRNLLVVCPAFINDCLETLEEMGIEGKAEFLKRGGRSFTLIPCLNDQPLFADVVADWAAAGHNNVTGAQPLVGAEAPVASQKD